MTVYFLQTSQSNIGKDTYNEFVGSKDSIMAITETGQFKVGDGVTPWKDLPWATTLPILTEPYTKAEIRTPKEETTWQKITGLLGLRRP